jgi:dTDP-4-amino-4,6-dideoxygalactose transaminase
MSRPVPFLDLPAQVRADAPAIERAFKRVLRSGRWILGPEVAAFESECSRLADGARGIGVNSGTDALVLALKALGIGKGDQVLVPSFTFVATAGAVLMAGAVPVICDIEENGFNIDPADVDRKAGRRAKAVIPVHLYGEPADMLALKKIARAKKLKIIEDACQALGARTAQGACGSLGDAAAVSFYPTKNLGGLGDGGLLYCKSAATETKARALRNHGQTAPYQSTLAGLNSRLDELQAAALRIRLKRLSAWNRARAVIALRYDRELADTPLGLPAVTGQSVWHQYTVRVPGRTRAALQAWLKKQGIASAVYYPVPLHRQKAYREYSKGRYPRSDKAARQVLSLPVFPELGSARQSRVIAALRKFYRV